MHSGRLSGIRVGWGQLRELERGRITLGAYFRTWLEWKRRLAPSTRARYEFVGASVVVQARHAVEGEG